MTTECKFICTRYPNLLLYVRGGDGRLSSVQFTGGGFVTEDKDLANKIRAHSMCEPYPGAGGLIIMVDDSAPAPEKELSEDELSEDELSGEGSFEESSPAEQLVESELSEIEVEERADAQEEGEQQED